MRSAIRFQTAAGFALMCAMAPAFALSLNVGEAKVQVKTRVSAGVSVRMEERDLDLVGKLSVPGQQTLCQADECGTVASARRFVAAKGSFVGVNADSGNWNYDQYDVVAASVQISPELTVRYGPVKGVVSGWALYDPVNRGFTEFNGDDLLRPTRTPRPDSTEDLIGRRAELREAYIQGRVPVAGRDLYLSIGNQVKPWGESLLVIFNGINQINPLDGLAQGTTGSQISDLLYPIPLAVARMAMTESFSVEAVVPLAWEPVRVPPPGSFFSTSDAAGRGEDAGPGYLILGVGKNNDDPDRIFEGPATQAGAISSATRTVTVLPESFGFADDGGEYGLRLSYFAKDIGQGVEFGVYYLRHHSRFPYLSAFASDESCARDSANAVAAVLDCRGFKPVFLDNPLGLEPVPVDTMTAFLDYPEDIDLYGLSFNTTLAGWSFSGEYAYRPNLPVQILPSDVVFAALQPSLPRQPISLVVADIPSSRQAVPDFLSGYRGIEIQPHDRIRGYERMKAHQLSLGGLNIWPGQFIGAESMLLLLEAGVSWFPDLTGPLELPIQGAGDYTHTSPGADGTGDPNGVADPNRRNPTQYLDGLATEWSWGWRGLLRLTYNDVLPNVTLHPQMLWFHDVDGFSPAPQTNFVEDRVNLTLGTEARIGDHWEAGLSYTLKAGGGAQNLESDRDFMSLFIAYTF